MDEDIDFDEPKDNIPGAGRPTNEGQDSKAAAEPEFFTRAGREFALLDWNPGQEGASAEADDDEE